MLEDPGGCLLVLVLDILVWVLVVTAVVWVVS